MNDKKTYTREEKITYYKGKIERHKKDLAFAEKRLAYLESDDYQDWRGSLAQELADLKKLLKKAGA